MARLLIVDDDPSIRFILRLILEGAGHQVSAAPNGAAALALLKDTALDLVVTDLMMPVMDGRELIERLRSDPDTALLPILVLSGNPHARDTASKADAVLAKPFPAARLLESVTMLLGAQKDSGAP